VTTPNYLLNTHAPDQTRGQSQLLQCELNLAAPGLSYSAFESE